MLTQIKKLHTNKIPLHLFGLLLFLGSCITNKNYVYLQDKGKLKTDSTGNVVVIPYEYKLQKGDILYISLSTDDERLNKIFIPPSSGTMQQNQGISGTQFYFTGFTINDSGELELPYLGKVVLAGQNINEAKITLEESLKKYFKVFFLQIKIAEFRFSVLGNVNRPGQYFFQQNKVTIMEAIAQAGDLAPMANRNEVFLYRQTPIGVKVITLDLTNHNLINSPEWFIQPNDILYIRPLKQRSVGDLTSVQTSISVITPLLSSLLLVLNTYILIKNLN